jgi:hypothetical protein
MGGVIPAVWVHGWLLHHLWDRVASSPITSPDAGWHLLTGRIITETGGVPRIDPVTFTAGATDWINLNWLAQTVLYQLYLSGGVLATTTLATGLLVGALLVSALTMRQRKVAPLPGLLALGAVLFSLLYNQGIRPRLWTYFLLAVFLWILGRPDPDDRFDAGRAAALLGLTWFWNHLHGGFVYGYALLGMDALGTTLAAWRGGRGWLTRRAILLGGVIVLGLAGFAVHPHGFESLPYVASYKQALGSQMTTILELKPLDFSQRHGKFAELYIAALALGLWVSPRRPHPRDLLIALPFLHLALSVRRGLFPFVLLTAPMAAALWTHAFEGLGARLSRLWTGLQELLGWTWRALPATLAGGLAVWCLWVVPPHLQPGVPGDLEGPGWSERLPLAPVRFLQGAPLEGRIFNIYRAGGLLGWALYPQQRIVVDGRGDLHTRSGAYDRYNATRELAQGWDRWLEEDGIEVVLDHGSSLLLRTLLERGWTIAFSDGDYGVLVPPSEAHGAGGDE